MAPRFFYGYIILALCFLNMVVMRGVNGAFSVYYLALLEDFSWSHSDGASVASVNFVVYALTSPLVGLAFDRFGPRVLMPLGGALVGIGLLLSSFADTLWHLYFSYGIITAVGQGALGFVSHSALIHIGSSAGAPRPWGLRVWDKVSARWSWLRSRSS